MAYVHSWHRVETPTGLLPPEPADAYGRLAFDTRVIVTSVPITLAGGDGTTGSLPVIDEGGIWLNGVGRHAGDGFAWSARPGPDPWWTDRPGERWWDACDTCRLPYDLVVCAVLIRAAVYYGPSVGMASDGTWGSPGWLAARQLVTDLFGTAPTDNPLEGR